MNKPEKNRFVEHDCEVGECSYLDDYIACELQKETYDDLYEEWEEYHKYKLSQLPSVDDLEDLVSSEAELYNSDIIQISKAIHKLYQDRLGDNDGISK